MQLPVGRCSGDRLGVAGRDQSLFECQLDLVGQFEQAQKIGDRRALLTHLFGERVLRKPALVDEPLHSQRDFDRVEVLPLDILHEGHGVQVLVVHLADVGGQRGHVGALCGAPAAFAADDDVLPVALPLDRDGLDDPQRADRVGQLVERLLVELRARLRGIGDDLRDGDFCHFGHRFEFCVEVVVAENGVQPPA